ncbi:uncharacterized protein TRIADDRAFT_2329, partial [Trichoplax adhaerens]
WSPPAQVAGMTELNRAAFNQVFQLPAIRIQPKLCSLFLRQLQSKTFNQQRIPNIQLDQTDKFKKIVLLHPQAQFDDKELQFVRDHHGELCSHHLPVNYDHWSVKDVLRAILRPDTDQAITSFESVGQIAHLNLRPPMQNYKKLIGQVILDKNPHLKTVVNKTSEIDNQFRVAPLEILAGDDCMITTVKENECQFRFDYSKVYWNSRLHTEHRRIIDLLQPKQVIVDVFAGVGPFAIPAARKNCIVYANDLNPDSYHWLLHNSKTNKLGKQFYTFNLDGRDFIQQIVRDKIINEGTTESKNLLVINHIIMNLPASAIEFLDVFRGLYKNSPLHKSNSIEIDRRYLPRIHCYCFSKAEDRKIDVIHQVENVLNTSLKEGSYHVYDVRDVAPDKHMMCISFDLPLDV